MIGSSISGAFLNFHQRATADQLLDGVVRARVIWPSYNIRKRSWYTAHCYCTKSISISYFQAATSSSAEAVRLFQDCVENWRRVARRGVDHLQHLGNRGLPLKRLVTLGFELGKLKLRIRYKPLGGG